MRSAFLGPAYKLRSLPLAAQTAINLYLELDEKGSGKGAFYGTPGLSLLATLGTEGCRGLHVAGRDLWAVYGDTLYRITSSWAAVTIGTLPNDSGAVQIFDNGIDLIVAHSDGWHTCLLTGTGFAAVTNSEGTSDGCFIDSFLVQAKEDGTYQWADVGTTDIDALNFASAEANPDPIIRTFADHRELFWFGTQTIERGYLTGDADAPFSRSGIIETGLLAKHSVAKADNTVFWLSRNEKGQGVVYRLAEVPERISDFAIEQAIADYAAPEDAVAYTYQQDGHHFYVIHFAEASWAYDLNVGAWTQLAYRNTTSGALERHRANAHAFFNGVHVVGDHSDGRLYKLDPEVYTDDGDPIYRERVWAEISNEREYLTFSRLELVAEMGVGLDGTGQGTDPVVFLSWSDDGGRTWSNTHQRSIGQIGEFKNRAVWYRQGKARTRYYKLTMSDPVKVTWMGVNIQ